ncbi:MAG: hypothetical protein ACK5LT_02235 [Lachnospirales bacterium]
MISFIIISSILTPSVYATEVDNIYLNYGYESYKDLKRDYLVGLEENDLEKQIELERIAEETL